MRPDEIEAKKETSVNVPSAEQFLASECWKPELDASKMRIPEIPDLKPPAWSEEFPVIFMTVPNFANEGKKLIGKIDANNDGMLQKNELESAAGNPELNRKERKIVDLLNSNYDQLSGLSKDGVNAITVADLDKENKLNNDLARAGKLAGGFENRLRFATLDKDGDGFLSRQEIERANVQTFRCRENADLQFMLDNYSKIMKASNDEFGFENNGISLSDLQKFPDKLASSKSGEMVEGLKHEMYKLAEFHVQRAY